MELELFRETTKDGATLGRLSINGVFFCHTLEDPIREIPGQPVHTWKIRDQTAIPEGRYKVIITPSFRFKTLMPELVHVPGFSGIRIHAGNGPHSTSGCILVGHKRGAGTISESRQAYRALFDTLRTALKNEEVWISIFNPEMRNVA